MPPVVVLVLGAAVWKGGVPSPTLRRRAMEGARLVRTGLADAVIGCGGLGKNPPSEAEVIRALCLEAGIDPQLIRLEDRSINTEQNIRFSLPILRDMGATQVIIVTDRYHAPRAWLIARRLGLSARISCPRSGGTSLRQMAYSYAREVPATALFLTRWIFGR